ncbi:MAG: hypothetical protein C0483_04680 [Pirellula sp.]|nr:hypothetical protein [Pirellula sp.]
MIQKSKPVVSGRALNEPGNPHFSALRLKAQPPRNSWEDVVDWHLERGITTVPVKFKGKSPFGTKWQKTTDPVAAFREYVGEDERFNIGILLGTASGVVDVDLDTPIARDLAPKFLPKTDYRWGRPGNPSSHYLYRCRGESLATAQFKGPDGTMHIEVRGNGAQSVIPPSTHESGEPIEYVSDGEPATVDYKTLLNVAGKIAAATLLVKNYPGQGGRNDYVLKLAGFFAHAGWSLEEAQDFIGIIAIEAGDDEFDSRMTTVKSTFEKHASGEEVTGQPALAELIGDDVVKLVAKWLHIARAGTMSHAASSTDVDELLEQARTTPTTFVADVLKDCTKVQKLVAMHKKTPALFSSLCVSLTTVQGLEKAGVATFRQAIVAEAKPRAKSKGTESRYQATDEGMFMLVGEEEAPKRLANFNAKVTNEIVYDDGVEQQRFFELEVSLNGRTITCTCSANDFAGMNWVAPQCGVEAIMEPGIANKEHLRVAIQSLSGRVPVNHRFTATGWTKDPETGVYCYVHAGGAIGPDGPMSNVQTEMDGVMARYRLPDPVDGEELLAAFQAFKRLRDVAPDRILIPLLAGAFRALFGPADFGLFLVGKTGTGKSELSALVNQFFGPELNSRNLPGSFTSTGNALEMQTFMAKDAVFTIDDFAPSATRFDAQKMHGTADRLVRAMGNGACRARLTSDATLRGAKPPRCMVLMSGEDVPQGHSIRARLLIIEVEKTDITPEAWKGALTDCQKFASLGRYAELMATFIHWLAEKHDERISYYQKARDQILNAHDETGNHRRTSSIEAQLLASWRMFAWFLKSKRLIDEAGRKALVDEGRTALAEAVAYQQDYQADHDEVDRFLQYLKTAMFQGLAHISDGGGKPPTWHHLCGYSTSREGNVNPHGTRIGVYFDEQNAVWLNATSAIAVAGRVANAGSTQFNVSAITLGKRLKDRGILVAIDKARGKNTVRRKLGDERAGYWIINAEALGLPHVTTMEERRAACEADKAATETTAASNESE